MTIPIEEIEWSCDLSISHQEKRELEDQITWRKTPHFPRRGRMAWHVFSVKPYDRLRPHWEYSAAKIKGVGVFNPRHGAKGRDPVYPTTIESPVPPSTRPLS